MTRENHQTQRVLDEALRTGPFGAALHAAITVRGMSLESLQRRLYDEGITVSVAALSYWQRGLRRPERAYSLRAVSAIERVLGLPRASLVTLLGPPRPRGRRIEAPRGLLDLTDTFGPESPVHDVLTGLDPTVNNQVHHLSMQGERWMHANRTWTVDRVRRVVRAIGDGIDRFVAIYVPDTPGELPPRIRHISGCRIGRTRADQDTGFQAAELIFDRTLRAGQAHIFEFEYSVQGETAGTADYVHGSRQPLRELILRAHFEPSSLPVRCYHVRRSRHDEPYRVETELQLSGGGTLDIVSLDSAPGIEGLHWEWE